MAELSSLVMDTDDHQSDSELDLDTLDEETALQTLKFREQEESAVTTTSHQESIKRSSWFSFRKKAKDAQYGPLSVQSGDIIRSNESINTTPEPLHYNSELMSPRTRLSALKKIHLAFRESRARWREGFYAILFPFVYLFVTLVFGRTTHKVFRVFIPCGLLIANIILVTVLTLLVVFWKTPSLNLNIKAFGIPTHPAQIHWDAYRAAAKNNVVGNQTGSDNLVQRNLVKRDVIPDCVKDPYVRYQVIPTHTAMELVYRVKDGGNILTPERFNYLHEIEKHIYSLPDYHKVCHKRSTSAPCDVLVSLLSWFYPQNTKDGSYITPPPDFSTTIQILKQNKSIALWFTGARVERIGDSYYTSNLLRAQIRVGLPIQCFEGKDVHRDEQNDLITRFFVSLIPYLESSSKG